MSTNRLAGLPIAQHRLCARVARLYYESELTQEQIGDTLGMSRMKVNRLLRLARETGIVQVRIVEPDEPFADLEHRLLEDLALRDVRIVASPADENELRSTIAAAASRWLVDQLEDGLVIGLGLGQTVAMLPRSFAPKAPVNCTFVTLEGIGVAPNAGFAAYDVTSRLADAAGGSAQIVSAPTFVSDPGLQDLLLSEPAVAASLDVARGAGLAIQSVGTVTAEATLYRHGTLTDEDLQELRDAGAVGDALGHFFNDKGQHVPWSTDNIHIGLTLDELKKLPVSALVAGGVKKVPAIRAALRGGFFNVLITDEVCAEMLLEVGR